MVVPGSTFGEWVGRLGVRWRGWKDEGGEDFHLFCIARVHVTRRLHGLHSLLYVLSQEVHAGVYVCGSACACKPHNASRKKSPELSCAMIVELLPPNDSARVG